MAKPDIFDEIIDCLRDYAAEEPLTCLSPTLLQEFFSDVTTEPKPTGKRTMALSGPAATSVVATSARQEQVPPPADLKNSDLATLWQQVGNCRLCRLQQQRTNVVFGEGNPRAELMFIGEGPGYHEDMQGKPFVGEAGNLLTKMIAAMGYNRSETYITNIVKCRPPNNRNPQDDEAAACLPYLQRQIELIAPKAIVLLGAVPLKYLLNCSGINRHRGRWLDYRGIPVMATFHPAYLLRFPQAKRDTWHDLQMVMQLLRKA